MPTSRPSTGHRQAPAPPVLGRAALPTPLPDPDVDRAPREPDSAVISAPAALGVEATRTDLTTVSTTAASRAAAGSALETPDPDGEPVTIFTC
ncbi:hypothetical protein ACIHCX_15125 [Streptomyces sp. NPDC052043]|uniref:hypothetical protein n=1 Tax=Streptomyces sp. NPDC052043 TaxID=3365684 RepID=UPI0037CFE974